MKERPIIMTGESVRRIYADLKTKSRRVVKPQPLPETRFVALQDGVAHWQRDYAPDVHACSTVRCPYGVPGDRLWVRETWRPAQLSGMAWYRADSLAESHLPAPRWRSPIHMPRWASRLTLEVTGVRVERLQEISEEDAKAEGIRSWTKDGELYKYAPARRHVSGELDSTVPWGDMERSASGAFAAAWDAINGKRPGCSWESDPWVWVVEFRRITEEK